MLLLTNKKTKSVLIVVLLMLLSVSLLLSVKTKAVKAENEFCPSLTMEAGASVKLYEEGTDVTIRFTSTIAKSDFDSIISSNSENNVRVVTIILPTDLLGETDFTLEALDSSSIAYKLVEFSAGNDNLYGVFDETESEYVYNACLYGLLEHNITREFSARTFIEVNDEIKAYSAYSKVDNSRSVYDVALKAIEDNDKAQTPLFTQGQLDFLKSVAKEYSVTVTSDLTDSVQLKVKRGETLNKYFEDKKDELSTVQSEVVALRDGNGHINYLTDDISVTQDSEFSATYAPKNFVEATWKSEYVGVAFQETLEDGTKVTHYKNASFSSIDNQKLETKKPNGYNRLTYKIKYVSSNKETDGKTGLDLAVYEYKTGTARPNSYIYDGNGQIVTDPKQMLLNEWYVVVVDISGVDTRIVKYLGHTADKEPNYLVEYYIAESYFYNEQQTETITLPSFTFAKKSSVFTKIIMPFDGFGVNASYLNNSLLNTNAYRYETVGLDKNVAENNTLCYTKTSTEYETISFDLNIFESTASSNGKCGFALIPYCGGSLTITCINKDTGEIVGADQMSLNTWYTVCVDISNIAIDKRVDIYFGTADSLRVKAFVANAKLLSCENTESVWFRSSIIDTSKGSLSKQVVDGEYLLNYKKTSTAKDSFYNAGLKIMRSKTVSKLTMDFYVVNSSAVSDNKANLDFDNQDNKAGGAHFPITFIDKETGLEVQKADIEIGKWYSLSIDVSKATGSSLAFMPTKTDGTTFEMNIKNITFVK